MMYLILLKKWFAIVSALLIFASGITLESASAAKKKTHQTASFSSARPSTGTKVFIFDSSRLKWAVYDRDGSLVRTGHGVGGKSYCPDVRRGCRTPVGTYRLYHKEGPNFVSSRYPLPHGGAPMPWGMFFHKGYAIHGSNDVPHRHASHGCIRVYPSDAKWLSSTLPIGSVVIVKPY